MFYKVFYFSIGVMFRAFIFYFILAFYILVGVSKPLTLVGYEMITANSAPHWLSIISYPVHA